RIWPEVWTHVALTRDVAGRFRIYLNGELDNDQGKPVSDTFAHLRIGWTAPRLGTAGWLTEYRVWNRARSGDEIRPDFDRSFGTEGGPTGRAGQPAGLVFYASGAGPWGTLQAGAKVLKTTDSPPLLTAAEAEALAAKFKKFRALAERSGDLTHGQAIFRNTCMPCHLASGQ